MSNGWSYWQQMYKLWEKKNNKPKFFFSTSDVPHFQTKKKRHAGARCFRKSDCCSYLTLLPKQGDSDDVLTNKMPSLPSLSSCYISFTLISKCVIKISDIQDDRERATVGSLMLPGSCQSTCYWRHISIFLVLPL